MLSILLFLLFGALLIMAAYGVLRYWEGLVNISPEEEAYEERVAALNERQANRISDDQLTHPATDEDAWDIMVARGRRQAQRRDRYVGDLQRRVRERRRP